MIQAIQDLTTSTYNQVKTDYIILKNYYTIKETKPNTFPLLAAGRVALLGAALLINASAVGSLILGVALLSTATHLVGALIAIPTVGTFLLGMSILNGAAHLACMLVVVDLYKILSEHQRHSDWPLLPSNNGKYDSISKIKNEIFGLGNEIWKDLVSKNPVIDKETEGESSLDASNFLTANTITYKIIEAIYNRFKRK